MEDASAMSLVAAAAGIDPAASHFLAAPCPGWTNVFADQHVGHAFADAARVLGPARFTDVVLLPSLGAGGGERYIIDVLHSLSQLQPEFRALVLAGEPSESHAWLHRLPAASTFLDIANSFPDLEEGERDLLVLRLVLASAPNARLHIKSSAFGERFARKYLSCLEGLEPIYYRFSDAVLRLNGADFLMGWGFDFVSSHLPQLRYVISDHQRIIDLDRARIGVSAEKWHCLYAAHEVPVRTWGESQTRRLLWASRITPEKRPPLMAEIARQLSRVLPDVTVDVFGGSDPSSGYMELLGNCSNIRLRGPFSDFAELGATAYDAFIYTSFFDGLPNVVLEAMAAGLIVIAPNVGGVGEVVMDGVTGLLSESAPTDEDMAHEYVERIRRLYCMSAAERRALGEAARELVRERHSLEAHSRRVHEVFLSGTTA
jgi:glycosyltransferase involved in cell wall biosynthesis